MAQRLTTAAVASLAWAVGTLGCHCPALLLRLLEALRQRPQSDEVREAMATRQEGLGGVWPR